MTAIRPRQKAFQAQSPPPRAPDFSSTRCALRREAQSSPLRVLGPRWLARQAVSPSYLFLLFILRTFVLIVLSPSRCCSQPPNSVDPLQPQASSAWLCWGQAIRCGTWASSSLQHSVKHRALNPQLSAIIILFQFPSTLPASPSGARPISGSCAARPCCPPGPSEAELPVVSWSD